MPNLKPVRGKGVTTITKPTPCYRPVLDYTKVRDNFQSADIIGWCGGGLLSSGIQKITRSDTTHISVILQVIEADIPRWKMMEAYEGGHGILSGKVEPTFISKRIKEYNGFPVWYKLHPDLNPYREAIRKKLWEYSGTGYDYISLAKNLFGRVIADDDKLFCSELMEFSFREVVPLEFWLNHPLWMQNEEMKIFLGPKACVPGDEVRLPFLQMQGILN